MLLALAGGWCGCATTPLPAARENLYLGRFEAAENHLTQNEAGIAERDRVLFFMERGTIRQARGDYEGSTADFVAAADLLEQLERISLSKDAGSYVISDTIREFRGMPYERVMLHAMTAMNHFARGLWDEGAIEARRMMNAMEPQRVGKYPYGAFGPYVAGFALERIRDPSNAALLYRRADEAAASAGLRIDAWGRLIPVPPWTPPAATNGAPAETTPPPPPDLGPPPARELVCFVLMGRSPPGWMAGTASGEYAEVFDGPRRLGRTYPLADTGALAAETERLASAAKAGKIVFRIVLKEVLSAWIEHESDSPLAGALARLVLIGLLEQEDDRRWESLPRTLQVMRVPCTEPPGNLRVVFHNSSGMFRPELRLDAPPVRHGNTWVVVCRELPPPRK